ncbi:unnamed protein product [Bemisia tabaci]|uniref:Calx-beta domain-containing protein n=1 Tax=Bemisia tabaci TaxID=7038 RepID=A0A9P0F617_BEMTA|nr:unnamed protein product [Bemisia tabaci]
MFSGVGFIEAFYSLHCEVGARPANPRTREPANPRSGVAVAGDSGVSLGENFGQDSAAARRRRRRCGEGRGGGRRGGGRRVVARAPRRSVSVSASRRKVPSRSPWDRGRRRANSPAKRSNPLAEESAPMVLALLLSGLPLSAAQDESVHLDNATQCQDGLILSVWQPQHGLSTSEVVLRGIVYFLSLIFMFLGVSIISDRFMSAIEVITSSERKIKVKKKDGTEQTVTVRVWNETVANLTLMALGSSAPEILLSIIEIYAKNFTAGDLGPGTIVGSAAYNLFVIISLCVYVVPDGEVRKIKHLRVFFVTATWSVFAYIWLYLILAVISEGVVEVWEGILTFLFFPATVLTAYMADRSQSHSFKSLRLNRNRVIVAAESGEINMAMEPEEEILEDSKDPESLADTLRMLKKENPGMSMDELERLAQERIMANLPKSRAFYRVQASRMLTGSHHSKISIREDSNQKIAPAPEGTQVFFRPQYYTVLENIGSFDVTVAREVADEKALRDTVKVDFTTEDGTAVAGSDYVGASGTIVFQPGEAEQRITLQIIDDDVFEENEHFYVHLTKARTVGGEGVVNLGQPATAVVMILDDDHCGSFGFADPKLETAENVGELKVTVYRSSGARGAVDVPFYTQNGTAKYGDHYGELTGGEMRPHFLLISNPGVERRELRLLLAGRHRRAPITASLLLSLCPEWWKDQRLGNIADSICMREGALPSGRRNLE